MPELEVVMEEVRKEVTPKVGPEIIGLPIGVEEVTGLVATLKSNKGVRTSLIIPMFIKGEEGEVIPLQVLIDTGCEMNLVRKGLVSEEGFEMAKKKFRLVTTNGFVLHGGDRTTTLNLLCKSFAPESGEKICLQFPTKLYEAEIRVDIILSFEWLVTFDINVKSREYGLETNTEPKYFITRVKGNLQVVGSTGQSESEEELN